MKKLKAILALLLALLMVLAIVGCSSPEEEPEDSTSPSAEEPSDAASPDASEDAQQGGEEEFPSYKIGMSNLASGVWIIDLHSDYAGHYLETLGMEFQSTSANFLSDQMIKDIQNSISSGVDGQIYYGAFGTLTESASQLFEEGEVYWSDMDQLIPEDLLDVVNANPYYCGAAGVDASAQGRALAEKAIEMGFRSSAIIAGAVGDVNHDNRINAWTEVF